MSLFKKLLNPFGGSKIKGEYQDISKDSKKVTPNTPSELLIFCRKLAIAQIHKNLSTLEHVEWTRVEHTYPAFDNMNFRYKNSIYSVIIDITDEEGNSYLPDFIIKRQLYAAHEYNLVPCKFPVIVDNPHEPDYKKIRLKSYDWNLINSEDNSAVNPAELSGDDKVIMSEWELRNYAIKFMIKYLAGKNFKVLSYQDTLEVDPQIWFTNEENEKCWLLVRTGNSQNEEVQKPKSLEEIKRRCFIHDGYFAGVIIEPADENEKNICRGDYMKITFNGLEKIHSTI